MVFLSFAYCSGVGMFCISRAVVAFSQLDPAHSIAILMTNVTLKDMSLLCQIDRKAV